MELKKLKRLRQLLNEFIWYHGIKPDTTTDELAKQIANEFAFHKKR